MDTQHSCLIEKKQEDISGVQKKLPTKQHTIAGELRRIGRPKKQMPVKKIEPSAFFLPGDRAKLRQ